MAVLLQIGSVLVLALGAALVSDSSSAYQVVLGGLVAVIPNSLFALRLALHRGRSPESYPVVFFLGQFAKIGLTVGLLAAFNKWLGPLDWLPLLLGLIVALKAPLFALLYVRSQPDGDLPGGGARRMEVPAVAARTPTAPAEQGEDSGSNAQAKGADTKKEHAGAAMRLRMGGT